MVDEAYSLDDNLYGKQAWTVDNFSTEMTRLLRSNKTQDERNRIRSNQIGHDWTN